jgi:hypothetical protein
VGNVDSRFSAAQAERPRESATISLITLNGFAPRTPGHNRADLARFCGSRSRATPPLSQQILAATALENARKQGDSATPGYQETIFREEFI